jgi:hypothetical protein
MTASQTDAADDTRWVSVTMAVKQKLMMATTMVVSLKEMSAPEMLALEMLATEVSGTEMSVMEMQVKSADLGLVQTPLWERVRSFPG